MVTSVTIRYSLEQKKGEIILGDTKEGLSNRAMLGMRESYQNPENYDILINPIDTNKYDGFIDKLAKIGIDPLMVKMHSTIVRSPTRSP